MNSELLSGLKVPWAAEFGLYGQKFHMPEQMQNLALRRLQVFI
jgi:hypothetical protein